MVMGSQHYSCPWQVCPTKGLEKSSILNFDLSPGRASSKMFILRAAESNWHNLDTSALTMIFFFFSLIKFLGLLLWYFTIQKKWREKNFILTLCSLLTYFQPFEKCQLRFYGHWHKYSFKNTGNGEGNPGTTNILHDWLNDQKDHKFWGLTNRNPSSR